MGNGSIYALLVGVGAYRNMGVNNLPTYRMDISMMGSALLSRFKMPKDNIRILAGENANGTVFTIDLAKAIKSFQSILSTKDTFVLYFSGHGAANNLVFSDGQIGLQSVIDFVDRLGAGNKIVILDCCYSGGFKTSGAKQLRLEDSINSFVGKGIAVFASSAANEVSRLGPNGNHSMFTGALSTAIASTSPIRKGIMTLQDIVEETQSLVRAWNKHNPGKEQQPIFRSSLGGTITFSVEEYNPYKPVEYSAETEEYRIVKVEPLDAPNQKRLCAFVILKGACSLECLPRYTKEIAEAIKKLAIHSTKRAEQRFKGQSAKAVWCYFGMDESDIINHLHFAYTIWAADRATKALYYKQNSNSSIVDDIFVYENTSYQMLRELQKPRQSREDFIRENKVLLSTIVTLAEKFIVDLQEVDNKLITIEEMQSRYGNWIREMKRKYIALSDTEVPPTDLREWSDEIINLAGWILDMALLIDADNNRKRITDREMWLIKNAMRHYHESLERLRILEIKLK